MEPEKKYFRFSISWALVFFLTAFIIVGAIGIRTGRLRAKVPTEGSPVTMQRLTGHAIGSEGWEFNIAAILLQRNPRESDGIAHVQGNLDLHGIILDAPGVRGTVVEVAPPSDAYPYWCIGMAPQAPVEIQELGILIYVKNTGDGKTTFDEVSVGGGVGYTCAANPVPDLEFIPAIRGDFKETSATI